MRSSFELKTTSALLFSAACGFVQAAPDEDVFGKSEGYPVCTTTVDAKAEERCLVGFLSRGDELLPVRKVARGAEARDLQAMAKPPRLTYFFTASDGHMQMPNSVLGRFGNTRNTGLLVLQGEQIVAERYNYDRRAEHRFASAEMVEAVVNMLIGIAIAEKRIGSDEDKVAQYLPALRAHIYGGMNLRDLMRASGVHFVQDYSGNDDFAALTAHTVGHKGAGGVESVLPYTKRGQAIGAGGPPCATDGQVLALSLRAAVGKPLAEYLSEKIWQPMGAESDATWVVDAAGYELGYTGLNATLRDWGRFGLLLANYGAVAGKQVIPADWVKAYRDGRLARETTLSITGVRGQMVHFDTTSKVVIVFTGVHPVRPIQAASDQRVEQLSLVRGIHSSLRRSRQD